MEKTEQGDFIEITTKKFEEISDHITKENDNAFFAIATNKKDIKAALCGKAGTVKNMLKISMLADPQLKVIVESALSELKFQEIFSVNNKNDDKS